METTVILGIYGDNGKEMETTIVFGGSTGIIMSLGFRVSSRGFRVQGLGYGV